MRADRTASPDQDIPFEPCRPRRNSELRGFLAKQGTWKDFNVGAQRNAVADDGVRLNNGIVVDLRSSDHRERPDLHVRAYLSFT